MHTADTKVGDAQGGVLLVCCVDDTVGWLDVHVDKFLGVDVVKAGSDLAGEVDDALHRHGVVGVHHVGLEILTPSVLHHDAGICLPSFNTGRPKHCHNIVVLQLALQGIQFSLVGVLDYLLLSVCRKALDCHSLAPVSSKVNCTKATLSKKLFEADLFSVDAVVIFTGCEGKMTVHHRGLSRTWRRAG